MPCMSADFRAIASQQINPQRPLVAKKAYRINSKLKPRLVLPVDAINRRTSEEGWQVYMESGHDYEDKSGFQNSYKVCVELRFDA